MALTKIVVPGKIRFERTARYISAMLGLTGRLVPSEDAHHQPDLGD